VGGLAVSTVRLNQRGQSGFTSLSLQREVVEVTVT